MGYKKDCEEGIFIFKKKEEIEVIIKKIIIYSLLLF